MEKIKVSIFELIFVISLLVILIGLKYFKYPVDYLSQKYIQDQIYFEEERFWGLHLTQK